MFIDDSGETSPDADSSSPITFNAEAVRSQVATFCGDCHAVPLPESFPRSAWYDEVKRGYEFYYDSGRTDLEIPPMQDVVSFYRSQAPESLRFPSSVSGSDPGSVRFRRVSIRHPDDPQVLFAPGVAFLRWIRPEKNQAGSLLFCDMRSGDLGVVRPNHAKLRPELRAHLANPDHAEPCDLNNDGRMDLIVADLGSFLPEDHNRGSVVWLRKEASQDGYSPIVIQKNLGRITDVEPGDFDGDGDLDLIVAEFGYQQTGRILLLVNEGFDNGVPRFQSRQIDERHGAIHVPVVDFNGDGHLDFVALISQEHEVIELFLNQGNGRFQRQTIFAANDPSFGSSGIQLVDFDGDGDMDVLYTNGDTFDSHHVKPYHGIQWLENRGSFPFVPHHLAVMPGVHRALAGDIDGDGDLDIVAVAFLPQQLISQQRNTELDSVMWLEQTEPGRFIRHTLEASTCNHAALELADFDEDGDLDLAVGNFRESADDQLPWFTVWWNLSIDRPVGDSP
jgi:hypothetical protein